MSDSITLTITADERASVLLAIALATGVDVNTAQAAGVAVVRRLVADGATAKDIVAAIPGAAERKVGVLMLAARLSTMVKSDEDLTGCNDAVRMLNGNGKGITRPAVVLKGWQSKGRTFATWAKALKALEDVYAEQNPTDGVSDDTDGEGGEGEGDEAGNGGTPGAPTLESEAARLGNAAIEAALALNVNVADLLAAVVGHVQAMERAATVAAA